MNNIVYKKYYNARSQVTACLPRAHKAPHKLLVTRILNKRSQNLVTTNDVDAAADTYGGVAC